MCEYIYIIFLPAYHSPTIYAYYNRFNFVIICSLFANRSEMNIIVIIYSAGHLVPTTFIGLADLLNPPKMEMHDQKNKMSF